MPVEDRTDHIIKCPKCKRSMGIKKQKQIAQREFEFICVMCHNIFLILLDEGFSICSGCGGSGIIAISESGSFFHICEKCNGFGTLDWIELIVGPPNWDTVDFDSNIFWIDKKR
jgi:hypothetical protein